MRDLMCSEPCGMGWLLHSGVARAYIRVDGGVRYGIRTGEMCGRDLLSCVGVLEF